MKQLLYLELVPCEEGQVPEDGPIDSMREHLRVELAFHEEKHVGRDLWVAYAYAVGPDNAHIPGGPTWAVQLERNPIEEPK